MKNDYTALLDTPVPEQQPQWHRDAHKDALQNPRPGFERAFVRMLRGWIEYAEAHAIRYEDGIGNDYVMGDEWTTIGNSLRALLGGEVGRLDCGTISSIIVQIMTKEKVEVRQ